MTSGGARVPSQLANLLTVAFGSWSLYGLGCVHLGLSFDALVVGSWIPLLATAAVWVGGLRGAAPRASSPDPGSDAPERPPASPWIPASLAVAVALAFAWRAGALPFAAFWVAALVHLASWWPSLGRRVVRPSPPPEPHADRRAGVAIALVAAAAVCATLVLHRPDGDDTYYFNAVITHLDHPGLALLSFDGMHGDLDAPIHHPVYRSPTYELLVAAVSRLTGVDAASLYYLAFPALFAVAFAVVSWLVIERFAPSRGWLGVGLVLLLLLAWGDGHPSIGNHGVVRLFQGKAVFAIVASPLIAHQAFGFLRRPGFHAWLLLALAQLAGVCFTSSALLFAPLAAAAALLAAAPGGAGGWRTLLLGLSTCAGPGLVLLLLALDLQAVGLVPGKFDPVAFELSFGSGWRVALAFAALLALPSLALRRDVRAVWTLRYVAVCLVLVLNGLTGPLVGEVLAPPASWRLAWALPVPQLVAAAFALGLTQRLRPQAGRLSPVPLLAAAALLLFGAAGSWAISPENGTRLGWPGAKVDPELHAVARRAVELAPPGSAVLAPVAVAPYVTRFHHAPRLILARHIYAPFMARHWGPEEEADRKRMTGWVSGFRMPDTPPAWVLEQIDRRGVAVVVTAFPARSRPSFAAGLQERGFQVYPTAPGYEIWARAGP